MHLRILILNCFFLCTAASGISQTNISGIVNSYHRVNETIAAKSCVRVDNTTGLSVNDLVMIVQMKGATVTTTNAASFGSVSAMNNAGLYEINIICAINGDSVFFYKQLLNAYTVSQKVQLVKIPSYASARVIDSLKAAPWDSLSGKGGVLALSVSDDLILEAPVSASAKGFRGGSYLLSGSTCSNFFPADNYFYNATVTSPQDGAYKGESVTDLALSYSGGKGAVANGGGGGNNHNNGGGGGSNLTAGGIGGGNSSASGCSAAHPGRGGYALSSSSGTRIFAGGGGGAGHANSGLSTGDGGTGGGIVFIQANTLYSNGFTISANGEKGDNALGDGASGGGGGGTLIMDVNLYGDAVSLQAKGGDGGNEDDDNISQKCYGEGGGGSGGVIYFKTTTPAGTVSVAGGAKGTKFNSLNCATLVSGTAGTAGTLVTTYNYRQSSTMSTTCTGTLAADVIYFTAVNKTDAVALSWLLAEAGAYRFFIIERKLANEPWAALTTIGADGLSRYYISEDRQPAEGLSQYRLQMVSADGAVRYSSIRQVKRIEKGKLLIYPNPAQTSITLEGPFYRGMSWEILDDKGRMIFTSAVPRNDPFIHQDITFLPNGIYYVRAGSAIERLFILRK